MVIAARIPPDKELCASPCVLPEDKAAGQSAGGRMAVLRLSDGSIWVHSPVSLDDELADALAGLGEVKHIVTPNFEHTKFAQQVHMGPFTRTLRAALKRLCIDTKMNLLPSLNKLCRIDAAADARPSLPETCKMARAVHDAAQRRCL